MTDIPDDMKQRLTATVIVTDDEGRRHNFGPADEVPAWARRKIRNARAWGYQAPPRRGVRTDMVGGDRLDPLDGRPTFVDIVCPAGAGHGQQRLIARFEAKSSLDNDGTHWEWHWTTFGRVDTDEQGVPVPIKRTRWTGEKWEFAPSGEDPGVHHAVAQAPDGRRVVRLRCCGLDLQRKWERFVEDLDKLRTAGVSELSLSALSRTIGS
jgi:hypothetical protein